MFPSRYHETSRFYFPFVRCLLPPLSFLDQRGETKKRGKGEKIASRGVEMVGDQFRTKEKTRPINILNYFCSKAIDIVKFSCHMRQPHRNERLETDDNNNLFITLAPRSSCTTLSFPPLSHFSPSPSISSLDGWRRRCRTCVLSLPATLLVMYSGKSPTQPGSRDPDWGCFCTNCSSFSPAGRCGKKSARVMKWSDLFLSLLSVVVDRF